MLDLRIYRTSLLAVVLAAIVFAFALQGQPQPVRTTLVPDAFNGHNAYANMVDLARPHRPAGSAADRALAAEISGRFRSDGYAVATPSFEAATPEGRRRLTNVIAVRQGMENPVIVVVAHRDARGSRSPALAEQSGTGVLLELGRVLSGETLNHTIMLVSTTGSTGTAGAAQLAADLHRPVDAVLVLGDLAGTKLTRPAVVPWSDSQQLAPSLLRRTALTALQAQAGVSAGTPGLADQLARLAFPMAFSEQAPFNARGIPAIALSASGEAPPAPDEPVSASHIERFGRTTLDMIDALDSNARVPAPSAYLTLAGKEVPAWAVRLLVLALIVPVAATALDGLARARRRGYAVGRPLAWVGASAGPFLAALVIVLIGGAAGISDVAPPGPVAPGAVPIHTGGDVLLVLLAVVVVAGFALIWATGGMRALGGRVNAASPGVNGGVAQAARRRPPPPGANDGRHRRAQPVGDPGAAAAILLTSCVLVLFVWGANPFAALLLVPALHLWMVALAPEPAIRPGVRVVLLALGFALPALLIAYYAVKLRYGPVDLVWSGVLMVVGGQIGILEAILLCLLMGCGVSAVVNVLTTSWASARIPRPPVRVRRPAAYAGPGPLRDTTSPLPRGRSSLRR